MNDTIIFIIRVVLLPACFYHSLAEKIGSENVFNYIVPLCHCRCCCGVGFAILIEIKTTLAL